MPLSYIIIAMSSSPTHNRQSKTSHDILRSCTIVILICIEEEITSSLELILIAKTRGTTPVYAYTYVYMCVCIHADTACCTVSLSRSAIVDGNGAKRRSALHVRGASVSQSAGSRGGSRAGVTEGDEWWGRERARCEEPRLLAFKSRPRMRRDGPACEFYANFSL